MTTRAFTGGMVAIALLAVALRFSFPTADPPWETTVGIVWHDEGAWVHNARNKALFGHWSEDAWNPMYIAPVFTGLEYVSFALFGVGVWQARLVSEVAGVLSVLLLGFGVRRLAGREAGIIAAALLATNYVYVMWNRAALMEASMVAFIVASWYCYVRAQAHARWGVLAAACALLAYFTKAAAIFFVAAIGVDAVLAVLLAWSATDPESESRRRAGLATLGGLVVCGALALALFVMPNWTEYRFYNWQMSVTRKPDYDLQSLLNRVTWFPIVHDIFTRMWFTVVVGILALAGLAARWRSAAAPERLLGLWIVLGTLELLLHDVGNERRFLLFVPALVGLTALVLGRDRRLMPLALAAVPRRTVLLASPAIFYGLYVICGALARLVALYEPRPGVRLGAALAAILTVTVCAAWPRLAGWLSSRQWTVAGSFALVALVCAGQLVQYGQWARGRSYKNYLASREIGTLLPAGTLVHGKLANGLALENRIKPIFVGREFGNYQDRTTRDDVRYILTYVAPYVGYEGPVIVDVLEAYPDRTIIRMFDVAETTTGHDRAALFDKFGAARGAATRSGTRAHD